MAYILSLEIGATDLRTLVASMTEPVRLLEQGRSALDLSREVQYVVRETDSERAKEIAGEFYANGNAAIEELVESATTQSDRDEQLARICELARRLGFNDAKTRMLIGQSGGDLLGLERKLLNALDHYPGKIPIIESDGGWGSRTKDETLQSDAESVCRPSSSAPDTSPPCSAASSSESCTRGSFE